MSQETLNELMNDGAEELTDFEKRCEKFKNCAECGCPTDKTEFEYAECIDDEDFLREQTHHGVCSRLIEEEID